jgi:hypothetical protein
MLVGNSFKSMGGSSDIMKLKGGSSDNRKFFGGRLDICRNSYYGVQGVTL